MNQSLTIKINKNAIMYFVTIIPFVPIDFIVNHFSPWSTICSYARILFIFFYLIRLIFRRRNISVPLILAILFVATALVSAFLVGDTYSLTIYNGIYLIGVTMIIEDGIYTDCSALIYGLLVFFEILIYLNLIYFLLPKSYGGDCPKTPRRHG